MAMNEYADFARAARQFLLVNQTVVSRRDLSIAPGWTWVEHKSVPGHGYATKTSRRPSQSQSYTHGEGEDEELEEYDESTCQTSPSSLNIQWHIVFSRTYLVPMLMFQAWTDEGSVLALSDIMEKKIVRAAAAGANETTPGAGHLLLLGSEFPLLQQTEHPTTQQIMWSIHPCNVRQAVETILPASERSSERWLETWLMLTSTLISLD